jgi:hypothetical protein
MNQGFKINHRNGINSGTLKSRGADDSQITFLRKLVSYSAALSVTRLGYVASNGRTISE